MVDEQPQLLRRRRIEYEITIITSYRTTGKTVLLLPTLPLSSSHSAKIFPILFLPNDEKPWSQRQLIIRKCIYLSATTILCLSVRTYVDILVSQAQNVAYFRQHIQVIQLCKSCVFSVALKQRHIFHKMVKNWIFYIPVSYTHLTLPTTPYV